MICLVTLLYSVSPSVYVVFSSLRAADNCGGLGSLQPNFTTSFAQDELSTSVGNWMSLTSFIRPYNYADLNDCFTSFVTVTRSLDFTTEMYTTVMPDWQTGLVYLSWQSRYDRCNPRIAAGTWMTKLDAAWASCSVATEVSGGPVVWDPPLALERVSSLLDPIITTLSSMTITPAAPSAAPPSMAAITSTAEASGAPTSSQARANPPPAASSESLSAPLLAPLRRPSTVDDGISNLAKSAENTDAPPSGLFSSRPPALDPGKSLKNADSTDLSPVTAFLVADETMTPMADSPGIFIMKGMTLTQGAAPGVIGSLQVSWAPGSILINGEGASLPAALPAQSPQTAASSASIFVATAVPGSGIVVSGSTIVPGAAAVTIDNAPYSMDPAASYIVIGGQTQRLSAISPRPTSQPTNIVIAGQTLYPAAPGASIVTIGDKTLSINGPAATIANTPVTLAPGGNIIIGTSTLTAQTKPTDPPTPGGSYFVIGSETFTVNPGNVVAAGKTLTAGGQGAAISGKPVSLGLSALIFSTETEKITVPPAATKADEKPGTTTATTSGMGASLSYITVGGETFAVGASDVVVDGKTLTPGSPEITVSGVRVSVGTSAFIVGTKTEVLTAATTGATAGIGGLIMSGLGGIGGGAVATSTGDPPAAFVGAAVKRHTASGLWLLCVIVFIAF